MMATKKTISIIRHAVSKYRRAIVYQVPFRQTDERSDAPVGTFRVLWSDVRQGYTADVMVLTYEPIEGAPEKFDTEQAAIEWLENYLFGKPFDEL